MVFDRTWNLDFEILGMPPGGFLGLSRPFCASSIFSLVMANYRSSLFHFFLSPPLGVLEPILSKKWNNY